LTEMLKVPYLLQHARHSAVRMNQGIATTCSCAHHKSVIERLSGAEYPVTALQIAGDDGQAPKCLIYSLIPEAFLRVLALRLTLGFFKLRRRRSHGQNATKEVTTDFASTTGVITSRQTWQRARGKEQQCSCTGPQGSAVSRERGSSLVSQPVA
jgi:hypothetical protein